MDLSTVASVISSNMCTNPSLKVQYSAVVLEIYYNTAEVFIYCRLKVEVFVFLLCS